MGEIEIHLPPGCKAVSRGKYYQDTFLSVAGTYNSTRPGFPFPITESKLSGVRSRTFDALAPANRAAKKGRENNMEVGMTWKLLAVIGH